MAIGGASGTSGGTARGIEAGRAFVRLFVKDDLSSQLKQIAGRLNTAGGFLMKTGGLLAAPFLASLPLLGGAAGRLGELTQIDRIAKAFGTTGESMSGLLGVLRAIGSETKEDIEGLTQFAQKVQDAATGAGGEGAKLFDGLAVSAKELVDLPIAEQFYRIHDAIRQLPQSTQMFKLSMLGGTDSMKKWIPLLSMTNDEVRRLAKTMEVSQQELTQANRATAALALTTAVLGRVWDLVAVGVSPVIEHLATAVTRLLIPVKEWLIRNRELVGILVTAALAVGAVGGAVFAAGVAFKASAFALSGFAGLYGKLSAAAIFAAKTVVMSAVSMWAALGGPATLAVLGITAAVAALGYLFFTQTDLGREWANDIGAYFAQTAANARAAYGGVVDALRGGDLQLAWQIATAALDLEWKRAWAEMKRVMREVWDFFGSGWDSAVYLLKAKWADFTAWMKKLWVDAVAFMNAHFNDEMRGVQKALMANGQFGAAVVLDVVAGNPKAFKDQIDAERDAARKKAQAEFDAKEAVRKLVAGVLGGLDLKAVADAQAKVAELNALAADKAAAAGAAADARRDKQLDRAAQTAGLVVSQAGGFLAQALGPRAASPQVREQQKANALLEQIRDAILGAPGLVWG